MRKVLVPIFELVAGIAVFGVVCSLLGVDVPGALMTISQAFGRPWWPMLSISLDQIINTTR